MVFRFFPLRFEFIARDSHYFPPGKAANILRGALGTVFRELACSLDCRVAGDARTCEVRHACPYARVFAPTADADAPSGLGDPPRPFVLRARRLEGRAFQPGQRFDFDLHVFSMDPDVLACFVLTFAALAGQGIGPRRSRAELKRVVRLAAPGVTECVVFDGTNAPPAGLDPAVLSLNAAPAEAGSAPTKIQVEFVSPTELKYQNRVTHRPDFPVLFGRIRDRVATLRALYGEGPLDLDIRESNLRSSAIRMTRCDLHVIEIERRSGHTGQKHPIGGFLGFAEYEGDLAAFLPWLEACRWTGVGRHAVWGNGEIAVSLVG